MKLKHGEVTNFGSYKHLRFDFQDQALALVYGPTGSGKSTLMDIAPWILYGQTAKDGNADEVRSWTADGEPTTGQLEVELLDGSIQVTRIRGTSSENDLFWDEGDGAKHRGKDLTETQKLLEKRLGVSAELYLTAAYFCDFSPTSTFFSAKAKDRRALFDKIADMELPTKLSGALSEARKVSKKDLAAQQVALSRAAGKVETLQSVVEGNKTSRDSWGAEREEYLAELLGKVEGFELEKSSKIQALTTKQERFEDDRNARATKLAEKITTNADRLKTPEHYEELISIVKQQSRCKSCDALPTEATDKIQRIQASKSAMAILAERHKADIAALETIVKEVNPYDEQVKQAKTAENHHAEVFNAEQEKSNPFIAELERSETMLVTAEQAVATLKRDVGTLERRVAALTKLYDLSFDLRGELLRSAVAQIEAATNKHLEDYFDAELRVGFSLEGADNLEVAIYKSGNACTFRQLSKGQRQLLKLCLSVSFMASAANTAGVHFDSVFFDESLDGLDSALKLKAYRLFETLATRHSSVLVIDHSEDLQNLFDRRYRVSMDSDVSAINAE